MAAAFFISKLQSKRMGNPQKSNIAAIENHCCKETYWRQHFTVKILKHTHQVLCEILIQFHFFTKQTSVYDYC